MLTAAQLRAARALLGVDQRRLAELSDLSVPTIQRMEASEGVIRGNVESLMKLIGAMEQAGIRADRRRRAKRWRRPRRAPQGVRAGEVAMAPLVGLICVGAFFAIAVLAIPICRWKSAAAIIYGALPRDLAGRARQRPCPPLSRRARSDVVAAVRAAMARRAFPHRCAFRVLSRRRQSRRRARPPSMHSAMAAMSLNRSACCRSIRRFSRHEPGRARRRRLQLPVGVGVHVARVLGARAGALTATQATARAGFVYLVMASFGTLALLLAFGLLAGPDGGYAFAAIRAACARLRSRCSALVLALARRRIQGRAGAAACLAAARPSGGAEPCVGADERRHDQGRHLRLHPHRVRPLGPPARWWGLPVLRLGGITAVLGVLYALMQNDLKRAARLQHGREYRHHLRRPRPRPRIPGQRLGRRRGARR